MTRDDSPGNDAAMETGEIGNQTMPLGNHGTSFGNHATPIGTQTLPLGNHTTPLSNHATPVGTQSMPVGSHTPSFVNHAIPQGAHAAPFGNHNASHGNHNASLGNHGNHTMPVGNHATPVPNHMAPLATLPTSPMEEDIYLEDRIEKKRSGTYPRMARFDVPEETPPNSQNSTLKAKEGHKPQRQNGSLKGPWNRKKKGVPVKEADTAKVLEMYLKRRSKSLNDAVLTREYFSQEKKRKVRAARNNTISVCSTISTDSTASEVQIHPHTIRETAMSVEQSSSEVIVDKTVFTRKSVTQQSFHEAMKCPIMEEGGSSTMEQSADDELSSSDEMSPRSRSAPSTLRMQIRRDTREAFDTLKLRDNGSATLTRDGYKRDSKKEPRRKRSFLDKAKQIIRSPSTSRKIVRTPSATQRHEEREKEKEKERLRELKEREKEEKERLRKEKQEKELLEKKLKELEKERKEREKEKLKEMEKRMKELKERREREEQARSHTRNYARTEVHHEMKKTGFTARLKETFRRSTRERHRDKHHREPAAYRTFHGVPPPPPPPPRSDSQASKDKDVKPKRWPSFKFNRKSRKSASTPTDDSAAGATTPSDTASMDFEYFAPQPEHTRSLNDAERRRLIIEMRRDRRREAQSGTHSDSQILDRDQPSSRHHPLLTQARSHDSVGSFASSEGSDRLERPRTLAFRRTRAERAQRGLNNVIRLDSTTPGHVRRDVDTAAPLLPPVPLALVADDLVRDGGGLAPPQGAEGGSRGSDRSVTDSYTESGDGSDIPFGQRNPAEREEYFKRIADRLAMIGDQALADYEFQEQGGGAAQAGGAGRERTVQSTCYTETYSSCSAAATSGAVGGVTDHSSEFVEIGTRIRTDVDGIQARRHSVALFPAQMVMGVIVNNTYSSFCTTMQDIVGEDVGWEQLAIVFKFTKVAVKAAHSMGKHASSIKNNSVRFIGDRFAGWLDSQGGWGSVVTSEDSDDSLHEESEID